MFYVSLSRPDEEYGEDLGYETSTDSVNQQPPRADITIRPPRPRPSTGYIDVLIDLRRSRFPLNDQITIPCTVNSYSRPNVQWSHNGRNIRSSQRIQVISYPYFVKKAVNWENISYTALNLYSLS